MLSSFGRRRGRVLRGTKQGLVDTLLPKLQLTLQDVGMWSNGDVEKSLFPHHPTSPSPPIHLEIGFGSGEHLAAQAVANPDVGFIGCEPYVNGFGNLLMTLQHRDTSNIRLYTDDARLLIDTLPEACLGRVFILFPDPWPKTRHHKRRLIQQPFLHQLARVMKPGAELRLATDHEGYLTWMLGELLSSPYFTWTARKAADWSEPPSDWVRTKYQEWAEAEGRTSTYLRFTRR